MIEYDTGENAFAFWTGTEWILKPICSSEDLGINGNAFAVKTPDGWALSPAAKTDVDENAVAITDAAGNRVLWPIKCPEQTGCTGYDPLCPFCSCEDELQNSYTVSISGIPDICTCAQFNGIWTLTWEDDCTWSYEINAYSHIYLNLGSPFEVIWSITYGPNGSFSLVSNENTFGCRPETYDCEAQDCYQPYGCWGLYDGFMDYATCVISA